MSRGSGEIIKRLSSWTFCCAICNQQKQDADSSIDGAVQAKVKANHLDLLKDGAVQVESSKRYEQERHLSIYRLRSSLICGTWKQKKYPGKGDTETSRDETLKQQQKAVYGGISRNEGTVVVRILVLGRSGAGKTTLIRLLVGNEGPQSISEGVAGVQDINKEFLYFFEEQDITFIIHDSNGMDVKGKERVDEIVDFLDNHQKCADLTERIHVIWYVISAIDPRFVDDGDVMKIVSKYKIPLLLIMTHKDYEKVKVTETNLHRLLQAYGDKREREALKRSMVRVSNDGACMSAINELIIDDLKRDTDGLRLVAERTKSLAYRTDTNLSAYQTKL